MFTYLCFSYAFLYTWTGTSTFIEQKDCSSMSTAPHSLLRRRCGFYNRILSITIKPTMYYFSHWLLQNHVSTWDKVQEGGRWSLEAERVGKWTMHCRIGQSAVGQGRTRGKWAHAGPAHALPVLSQAWLGVGSCVMDEGKQIGWLRWRRGILVWAAVWCCVVCRMKVVAQRWWQGRWPAQVHSDGTCCCCCCCCHRGAGLWKERSRKCWCRHCGCGVLPATGNNLMNMYVMTKRIAKKMGREHRRWWPCTNHLEVHRRTAYPMAFQASSCSP